MIHNNYNICYFVYDNIDFYVMIVALFSYSQDSFVILFSGNNVHVPESLTA